MLNTAMNQPRAMPPTSARGRLTSRPTAAAAIATTTSVKKSVLMRVLNPGAMSTPASPAKVLEIAQASADTRSAGMPASSVIRGLSTTPLMARPTAVNRKRAPSRTIAATATRIWASSSRLNG